MVDNSTFADRLWWARHRAGLGATRLARIVGCAQSLISGLERNNAERSKLNNKFADALKVDRNWLAYGTGVAPEGFDPEQARKGRENMSTDGASVVALPLRRVGGQNMEAPVATSADAMMDEMISLFLRFARAAGPERTKALVGSLDHLANNVVFKEAEGQHDGRAVHERNKRT
jgi:hypothetical protein